MKEEIKRHILAALEEDVQQGDYSTLASVKEGETKKVKLVEGQNKLKIGDMMKSKQMLFLKLLWDDTNEESLTLTKPNITYTEVK